MTPLIAISLAIMLGAMSPGPSFVMVARTALSSGKSAGRRAALGMALAGTLFAIAAVVGLAALLVANGPLFTAFRVLGSSYLAYIGVTAIIHAKTPLKVAKGQKEAKAGIWKGFTTQVSNPKTIVVYASVFASLLPHSPEPWLLFALPLSIGVIEGFWYLLVANAFGSGKAVEFYARSKRSVDYVTGAIMILLAIRLAIAS
jgi:threonine/homoserine/homoserine lactone efflux protein